MLMGALLALSTGVGFADDYGVLASDPVRIMVDGNEVSSYDEELNIDLPAVIVNGRTMLPLKRTFALFGVDTVWNGDEKSITADTPDGGVVWIQIDNSIAKLNGVEVVLDASPTIFNNRTFVPLAFISEAMGVKPEWDGSNRAVMLNISSIKGVRLPESVESNYRRTFENDDSTTYFYHNSRLFRSIEVKEETDSRVDVLARISDQLNVGIEEFYKSEQFGGMQFSYKGPEKIDIYYVVLEIDNVLYSMVFKDFGEQEMIALIQSF